MDTPHVLSAKVRRPQPVGLVRARLQAVAAGADVAVLVAPAGSGKTTLLGHVAAAAACPVGWYRAGVEDASPETVTRYLARALEGLLAPGAPSVRTVDDLVAALERTPAPAALLVVDDAHEIVGTDAELSLERLLHLRPAWLQVIISSRRPPSIDFARVDASSTVRYISADDLRFRSWEVEQLFRDTYGEPLPPESSSALCRHTGGWAAALKLFHLAAGGKPAAERVRLVSSLSAQSRLIAPYLARNVLAELGEQRRHFLVRTAALRLLTGPLCDALLGAEGSASVLRELEQRQLFTTTVDDGTTFRYHQVLQSHLELALVEELGMRGARAWFQHAGTVLAEAGHAREAMLAYGRAEDWGSVARLLQRSGPALLPIGSTVAWGELIPATLWRSDPWLVLAEAHRRVRQGDLAGAVEAFRLAESLTGVPSVQAYCRRQRQVAAAWTGDGDVGAAGTHWAARLRAAIRRLPVAAGPPVADTVPDRLAAGLALLLAGRFPAAARVLVPLAADADGDIALLARVAGTCAALLPDGATYAADRLDELAMLADLEGHTWLARLIGRLLSVVLSGSGTGGEHRLGERGALPVGAGPGAGPGDPRDCDPWGDVLVGLVAGVRAVVTRSGGQDGDAVAGLQDTARRCRELGAPVLEAWAVAAAALDAARQGSLPAAAARRAETLARAVGARGAQALALAALAEAVPGARRSLAAAAREIGRECGLPAGLLPEPDLPGPAVRHAPRVHLQLFGGFRLGIDGAVADLPGLRPRARALLRLLAASYDRHVHREQLIDALWPGADPVAGLRSLHVAVSSVRRALDGAGLPGPEVLARTGDAYRFSVPRATVDLLQHAAALRSASLAGGRGDVRAAAAGYRTAVEVYTGDLLPEDGLAEWVLRERDRLRSVTAAAALELAQCFRSLDELENGVAAAERAAQLDPFSDPAWRLLAELHEQLGNTAAAARARREHAGLLAELGPAPPVPTRPVRSLHRPRAAGARV